MKKYRSLSEEILSLDILPQKRASEIIFQVLLPKMSRNFLDNLTLLLG